MDNPNAGWFNLGLSATAPAITFLLVILGGIVWSTGSALACPDWPLCYGQFFPRMEGQILLEHGHRLVAATVATLTVVLAYRCFGDRRLRALGLSAAALVLVQAILGGMTVLLKLPLLVRVLHLATSQAFFATLLVLAVRVLQVSRPAQAVSNGLRWPARRGVLLAAGAVYLQLLLGAVVRHTGSGMACPGLLACDGSAWPSFGPGQVQMLHRYWALGTAALVIWGTLQALPELRGADRRGARRLAIAAHVLLLTQIGLGLASVASFLAIPVVTAHLATGALLWGDLVVLWANMTAPASLPNAQPDAAPLSRLSVQGAAH